MREKGSTLGEQKGKRGHPLRRQCGLDSFQSRSPSLGLRAQCPSPGLEVRYREGRCVPSSVVQWADKNPGPLSRACCFLTTSGERVLLPPGPSLTV